MILPKRLLNLVGTLVVLIAFVAGTLLTALPVYLESRNVKTEEAKVAASNQLLVAQIDALRAKEAELPRIEEELAGLARQVASTPQLDDVTELVVKAAKKTGAEITGVDFGEPGAFAPRTAETVLESLPQTAVDLSDPARDAQAAPQAQDSGAGGTIVNELQFPTTITAELREIDAAVQFLDELRSGPRLLQITTAVATTNSAAEDQSTTLTVTGFVFVRLNG